jgi:VanZ family protein
MVLIFSASSDSQSQLHSSLLFEPFLHWLCPGLTPAQVGEYHHLFRKFCHLVEYVILALLIRRTLVHGCPTGFPAWSWKMNASVTGLVFLYAASDEFHQIYVPTRTPLFSDVIIDTCGGLIGLLALRAWQRLFSRT